MTEVFHGAFRLVWGNLGYFKLATVAVFAITTILSTH